MCMVPSRPSIWGRDTSLVILSLSRLPPPPCPCDAILSSPRFLNLFVLPSCLIPREMGAIVGQFHNENKINNSRATSGGASYAIPTYVASLVLRDSLCCKQLLGSSLMKAVEVVDIGSTPDGTRLLLRTSSFTATL